MEHWAQKCDGAGIDPAEYAAVCRERDALKAELAKVTAERELLLRAVRTGIDACNYCRHDGAEPPCHGMDMPPDCDECVLEKAICCKCYAGSNFEFVGVKKEERE